MWHTEIGGREKLASADFIESVSLTSTGAARGIEAQKKLWEIVAELQSLGCTFFRAEVGDSISTLVVEGWIARPEDQGPTPP